MIKREDCLKIGEIGKTHGVNGAVVVYTDNDLLEEYREEPVFILLEGAPVPFYIAEDGLTLRNHSSYIVKFDYVDSREQAERLVGKDLLLDKDLLDEEDVPSELDDLRGYSVLDERTGERGELLHVDNYSGNVVFAISLLGKEILLPYSEDPAPLLGRLRPRNPARRTIHPRPHPRGHLRPLLTNLPSYGNALGYNNATSFMKLN